MKNKLQIYREEAVRYLAREKDEEALLDFITKSFVFNESDTEQELEEAELAVEEDKEDLDIDILKFKDSRANCKKSLTATKCPGTKSCLRS